MRILWVSNWPEEKSGYGRQTAYWVRLLAACGHEVAVFAFHGVKGAPTTWQGIPVFPAGDHPWGSDVLQAHACRWNADLVITLQDMWPCDPASFRGLNVAHWVPVDTEPLGSGDTAVLEASGGRPIAMSVFGSDQLCHAGFDPLYVPHGIDTSVFTPILPIGRAKLRKLAGIDDRQFVIGINAANQDQRRKSYPQQFLAFRQFLDKHDDALLLVHTRADNRNVDGLNLVALARACGLEVGRNLMFSPQYEYRHGLISDEDMANWYRRLDVLSLPSHAEGFGIPLLEAQACGVPVVTSRFGPMTELCGAGWLVDGDPYWIRDQEAWWQAPRVAGIVHAYERAYQARGRYAERAREFAEGYDIKRVFAEHWAPALDELATTGRPGRSAVPGTTGGGTLPAGLAGRSTRAPSGLPRIAPAGAGQSARSSRR